MLVELTRVSLPFSCSLCLTLNSNRPDLLNASKPSFERTLNPSMSKASLLACKEHPILPIRPLHGVQELGLLHRTKVAESASTSELISWEDLRCSSFEKIKRPGFGEDPVEVLSGDLNPSLWGEGSKDSGVLLKGVCCHDDTAVRMFELGVAICFGEHGVADRKIADETTV